MPLDDRAIAISATFTAEAIQPGLAFWAAELGLDQEIRFAPYNQVFQQLLDPGGLFARNRSGFNIALVRFQDWSEPQEQARRLAGAIHSAAGFAAPLIVVVCPATPAHEAESAACERVLLEAIGELPAVHVLTPEEVLSLYPVAEIHDPHGEELGCLPYTPLFFVALATAIARKIHALSAPPFKVIALDCDATLWAGICGEDGPRNVAVDRPRRALQEFMAERRRSGMLLALCSKNNEADVVETFRVHPEMPLHLEDFAATRINWDSKAVNLAALSEELELGLDTFILVDDSAKECDEVRAGAPQVLTLALPSRASDIPEFLKHVWAFDRPRVTEEDRRRAELYAQRAERARAERSAGNLEEFLATLRLEVRIAPMEHRQVARVAQLTNRTNQMNVTCRRRTESEIQALADLECLMVEVTDRFGSYGLVGVIIFGCCGRALTVDTFLLSCRALGRGVEHRMLARLGAIARERGLDRVEIPFVRAERNRPAALFLESLAEAGSEGVFRFTVEQALAAKPAQAAAAPRREAAPTLVPAQKRLPYARIANELRDPQAILDRIRASALRAAPTNAGADPPRTPLERELAEVFAGMLNLRAVGIHDHFFELGGHSLLAVQLLSQVRQTYGVELSLELVYSGEFSVAELAKAIELKEIEQSGAEYQDLLRELEALSDEEARALLAEEQDAS